MFSLKTMMDAAAELRINYSISHPHWQHPADSPLKYVDWALHDTISKSLILAQWLNPPLHSSVFEIGPGTGYLMYILKELWGCEVHGCDTANTPLYHAMWERLGLDRSVKTEHICPFHNILSLNRRYDYLVATQISWMDKWSSKALNSFLADCAGHVDKLVLFPNPGAFCGEPLLKEYSMAQSVQLPYLGTGAMFNLALFRT